MKSFIHAHSKAIAGGLASGLTVLAAVIDNGITPAELVGIAIAVLAGTGITYVAPANTPEDQS